MKAKRPDSRQFPVPGGKYRKPEAWVRFERVHDVADYARTASMGDGRELTAYRVWLGEVPVGRVFQSEEHTYRKAGRLRYDDRYPVRWAWAANPDATAPDYNYGLCRDTRGQAAAEVVRDYVTREKSHGCEVPLS